MGMMSFTAGMFWLSFYLQDHQGMNTLDVAVHLIPQCVAGLLWNVVAGNILHRVNNTLIMVGASASYLIASLLLSLMKPDSSYWAFIFPALILNVFGADFQFNVVNVSLQIQQALDVILMLTPRQMYVMQSLPSHQQSLAGGIFNTIIRLCIVASLAITTAVYNSVAVTPEGQADSMLKYTKTFQCCVGLSAAGFLFLPFIKLGTQGNVQRKDVQSEVSENTARVDTAASVIEQATDVEEEDRPTTDDHNDGVSKEGIQVPALEQDITEKGRPITSSIRGGKTEPA
jgi:hypothetical protein